MAQIDPRFRAPDYLDRLSHFLGIVLDVRFVKKDYGTPEASGAFPPPAWAGDAIAPRPRSNIPTPQGIGRSFDRGVVDYEFNRRGG